MLGFQRLLSTLDISLMAVFEKNISLLAPLCTFFHFYMLFLQFLNAIKCSDMYGTYNTTYISLLL